MENLTVTAQQLLAGKMLFYATDTCLGLGHAIDSELAQGRLYAFKEMPANKPVSILVDGLEMARRYADFDELALKVWGRFMPGALTLLLHRKEDLPAYLNPGSEWVGVRYIDAQVMNKLIASLGCAISTTSANKSGKPVADCAESFFEQFADTDQLISLVEKGRNYGCVPSTIVKVDQGRLELIRAGELAEQLYEEFGAYID